MSHPISPSPQQQYAPPAPHQRNLDTNRSLTKYILLSLVTLGIYQIWVTARAGDDLNTIAGRWDGSRLMNYWLMALLVNPVTLGIGGLCWWHGFSNQIGLEQQRRDLRRTVTSADFWLWGILGSFILIGPFIYAHKWLHAMNDLARDYNQRG